MGSSKRPSHWSTARFLVMTKSEARCRLRIEAAAFRALQGALQHLSIVSLSSDSVRLKGKGICRSYCFEVNLGQTPGTMVVGSVGGLCEGAGVLPYRVARNAQLSSDLA